MIELQVFLGLGVLAILAALSCLFCAKCDGVTVLTKS